MKLVPILALPSFVANGTTPLAFFMVNSSVAAALGLKALGLFAVALQMFQVTMFIPAAINGPTLGYLSARFSAGEQRTYSGAAMQSVRLLLAAVIPLVGLMLLLAPGLIRGLYGATYAEAAPASIVLLLASPAMLVSSGLSLAMIAAGRAWTACAAAVVWLLLVGSLVMLGARAGLLGVAAAIAVSCYCGAAATIYLARPLLRFDDLPSRRTVTLLALSLLVPAALGWTALGWTACVIVAVPLQGVVVLGLWTLMLTPEDKRALVALLVRAGLNLDRYGAERPANCSQTQVDLTIGPL
jgi:O-antigen/teichoic acid export membrane protein